MEQTQAGSNGVGESSVLDAISETAREMFQYLRELKGLQSPVVSNISKYEQVLWFSEVPREPSCFCRAWELIRNEGDERKIWLEVKKPKLQSPPELPDDLEIFVNDEQLNDSSLEEPKLLEVSNDALLRQFYEEDEDFEPDLEELQIDEHEEIFEKYVSYTDELWIPWAERRRADKESAEPPPAPPEDVQPWLKDGALEQLDASEPELQDHITVEIDRRAEKKREELQQSWREYVEAKWKPWAVEDRRLQAVQGVYNQLYTTYQRQQRLGEQFEVALGFGLLAWNAPKSGAVRRHLLTVKCNVEFDAPRGIISVGPTADGDAPVLEYDMLDTSEQFQDSEMRFLTENVTEIGEDFWEEAPLRSILEGCANALAADGGTVLESKGEYHHTLEAHNANGSNPTVSLAPALILRKRSQRGFIQLLMNIEDYITEGGELPRGIVEIISDDGASTSTSADPDMAEEQRGALSSGLTDSEIYFPLPANKEQREIISRLNRGRGVLVQGPPGTGKSHTIVNLICHLLASGERVLVTSETNRALHSLKSRFIGGSQGLAELCVILLGNDEDAFQQLEQSVCAISDKKAQWNPSSSQTVISGLRTRLDEIRRRKQLIRSRLREIREQDVYQHHGKFERFSGTLQKIAQQVSVERINYKWLKDNPSDIINFSSLPFKPEEFIDKWIEYRESYSASDNLTQIPIQKIPPPSFVGPRLKEHNAYVSSFPDLKKKSDEEDVAIIRTLDTETVESLSSRAHRLLDGLTNLDQHHFAWAAGAAREIVAEQDRAWRELFELSCENIASAKKYAREVAGFEVLGLDSAQFKIAKAHAARLQEYLVSGKKIRFRLLMSAEIKETLYLVDKITVDGQKPNTAEIVDKLLKWLKVNDALNNLKTLWSGRSQPPTGSFSITLAHFEDLMEPLEQALELHPLMQSLQQSVDEIQKLRAPKWYLADEVRIFCNGFDVIKVEAALSALDEEIAGWVDELSHLSTLPEQDRNRLVQTLKDTDIDNYLSVYNLICEKNSITKEYMDLVACVQPLRESIPKTFEDFDRDLENQEWVVRFSELRTATQCILADHWLKDTCDPATLLRLNSEYDRLHDEELDVIGELAAECAWGHCMERLTEKERRALVAWMQAMEKIRKGYGRHAERHRRTAREKMKECQQAIPAWVMPLHRVVETVPAIPEIFDVAIIDEASQSGPEAVILNFLAKKVIVVGDDKQIRPRYIGLNHDNVEVLRNRHLKGVSHSESFDLNSSYFSQAHLRFVNPVPLIEHFRCMPEIIQFSNNNFYQSHPLIPLRQFGSERLTPVVECIHVPDGYRVGKSGDTINRPEAEAIVLKITECCADPDYENKTMGVITLLGNKQAVLIEELLVNEMDASEIEERNISVGVPYSFQGDERDVIFLSMVDAPVDGKRCKAVTSQEEQRKFNVAASRARDQMILFHSADQNDLKPDCLRYKLLAHCRDPRVTQTEIDGTSVDEYRRMARDSNLRVGTPPKPFDSWFEIDVYLDIVSRGYRVLPQYKVNPFDSSYRIDLAVEGLKGRLAVECDGDKWHGAAQFDSDLARQREIQRHGWTFWRVRGGAYYRNKEGALQSLWAELERAEIYPAGYESLAVNAVPVKSEERQEEVIQRPKTEPHVLQTALDFSAASKLTYDDDAAHDEEVEPEIQLSASQLSPSQIQWAIIEVLKRRPKNSIAVKHLTKEVCQKLGVRTRGNPRKELDNRIRRSVGVLKRKERVEAYKSKNQRIRLI